jgi:orotidine-5'-phosphate decarboxylase
VNPKNRLIVALDVATGDEAAALTARLAGHVGMVKVGKQLFTAAGPAAVRRLIEAGAKVFLDLKYHDIPNTVSGAVAAAASLGVSFVDVHALGGRSMMSAAATALAGSRTSLLAVTVLTSHDDATLSEIGIAGPVASAVERLALLSRSSGAHGVVASPHEIAAIRAACGPDFLIVTPGIRPAGAKAGDQARAATPAAALRAGADYLVVGRPIIEAPDPASAAAAIVAEMAAARPS